MLLAVANTTAYADPAPGSGSGSGNGMGCTGGAAFGTDVNFDPSMCDPVGAAAASPNMVTLPLGCNPALPENGLDSKSAKADFDANDPTKVPCKLVFGEDFREFQADVSTMLYQVLAMESMAAYEGVKASFGVGKSSLMGVGSSDANTQNAHGGAKATVCTMDSSATVDSTGKPTTFEGLPADVLTQAGGVNSTKAWFKQQYADSGPGRGHAYDNEFYLTIITGGLRLPARGATQDAWKAWLDTASVAYAKFLGADYPALHGDRGNGGKNYPHTGTATPNWTADRASCGNFCTFDTGKNEDFWVNYFAGASNDSCQLENNWIRGNWFNSKFYFWYNLLGDMPALQNSQTKNYDQFFGDNTLPGKDGSVPQPGGIGFENSTNFPNYEFKLTDVNSLPGSSSNTPLKPCGNNAADIVKITKKITATIAQLRKQMPADQEFTNGVVKPKVTPGGGYLEALDAARYIAMCIKAPEGASGASAAFNPATAVPNPANAWRGLCRRKDLADLARDPNNFVKVSSPGVQSLIMAQMSLVAMWELFSYCEVSIRSEVLFFKNDPSAMFQAAWGDPNDNNSYAHRVANWVNGCDDDDAACATDALNKGYRNKMFESMATYYAQFRESPFSDLSGGPATVDGQIGSTTVNYPVIGDMHIPFFKDLADLNAALLPARNGSKTQLPQTFSVPKITSDYYQNVWLPKSKGRTPASLLLNQGGSNGPNGSTGPAPLPRKTPETKDRHAQATTGLLGLVLGSLSRGRRRKRRGGKRSELPLTLKASLAIGALFVLALGCDASAPSFCDVHNKVPRMVCETTCPCGNAGHNIDVTKDEGDPDCPIFSLRNTNNPMLQGGGLGPQAHGQVTEAAHELGQQNTVDMASNANTDNGGKTDDGGGNTDTGKDNRGGHHGTTGTSTGGGNATAGTMYKDDHKSGPTGAGGGVSVSGPALSGPAGGGSSSGGNNGGGAATAGVMLGSGDSAGAKDEANSANGPGGPGGVSHAAGFDGAGGAGGGRGRSIAGNSMDGGAGGEVQIKDSNAFGDLPAPSTSLFDVVSKRYVSWNDEIRAHHRK